MNLMIVLKRIPAVFTFFVFYLWKLVTANIAIAYDILTPRMRTSPGFLTLPLTLRSRAGQLLFSNLLSMTPGTLTIDISDDRKTIIVHVLYARDEQNIRRELESIQERIRKITE